MHRLILLLLIVGGLAGAARAEPSLDHARQAEALLGVETWSRVVKIEHERGRSAYPPTIYGLVFEFGGLLWFYCDLNGTRSISRFAGRLEADQADFASLLRRIGPGVGNVTVVTMGNGENPPRRAKRGTLPFGCFLECVAALRECVARGDPLVTARLLSFYGLNAQGPFGHTVLTYETPTGAYLVDAQEHSEPRRIGDRLPEDPQAVVRKIWSEFEIEQVRWVPTPPPTRLRVAHETPARRRAVQEAVAEAGPT